MSAPSIADLVQQLDLEARLKLVRELWDSIAESSEELPLSPEDRALLDRRIAAYEANPDAVTPWPELRARLLTRR